MKNKIFFNLLLIFIFASLTSQKKPRFTKPDKDSFVPIDPNSLTLIELKEGQRELYFSFENQFDDSDIVVNVKKAKQYTTHLYIYDSYESIETDTEGEYINFLEDLDLSEKLFYIKDSNKTTYYIIIKDVGGYSTKDYFSIYNEKDLIELKEEEPFTINMFLSQNLYTLYFEGEINDTISLDLNINNADFSESIVILLNDEQIYYGERNKGTIILNEDKTLEGTYTVYISSTDDEIYTPIKSSFVLYKEKLGITQITQLEPDKEVKIFYVNSRAFNFYVDIDDYELNEENVITCKFSHTAYMNKLIEYCYAKNMNFEEFDANKFISNMPAREDDNEAQFSRHSTINNVYHLYYSRTKEEEPGKRSYLLVRCSMKIDDDLYFDPDTISVFLSPKALTYDLSDEKYLVDDYIKINEQINIDTFIPQICRIKIPINEEKLSYVFYTNSQIQTVYEDSMKDKDHKEEELRLLYVFSNNNLSENKTLYIKLFGAQQEVNFRAESTNSDIYYVNGQGRPIKAMSQQHLYCGNSFYYIGSYGNLADNSSFYLEEIYGQYSVYYKNTITNKDDDSILTNGNSKYLIDGKTANLTKIFDIVEFKCESPGYFNFHLLKTYLTKSLTMYQRQVTWVPQGKSYIYPNANEGQENINVEIYTPLGKGVDIYDSNGTKYTINEDNKYCQLQYKTAQDVPLYYSLYVKSDNTLLSIKLTDSNLYNVVESNHSKIIDNNILFKLDNSQNYKNVNITMRRVYYDYSYTMFRGDINYAIDILSSGYDIIPIGEKPIINFILSNPYIKPYSMTPDKEESPFYIMFHINDDQGIQKGIYMEYSPVDEYEPIPNSVSNVIMVTKDKYKLESDEEIPKLSVLYQSCGNSLKEVDIYSYDDVLYSFYVTNKYNLGVFKNYSIPQQVGPIFEEEENITENYTGAIIGISLNELSQSDIDEFNNKDFEITQDGKILKWDKIDGVKEYIVYVFDEENEDLKYIHNPCYLDYIQKNNTTIDYLEFENNSSYIAHYSAGTNNQLELKENGTFITTVMADLEGKFPMKLIYKEFYYNSSVEPPDEDDDDESNALLIVISIILPIILIVLIVLVIFLRRKKKQREINIDDTDDNRKTNFSANLINDSRNTIKSEDK